MDDPVRRGLVKVVLGKEGTYGFLREEMPEDIPEGAGNGSRAIATDILLSVEKAAGLCTDMDLERWLKIYNSDEHHAMIVQDQNSLLCRMRGEMRHYARTTDGVREIHVESGKIDETPEGLMPFTVEIDVPHRNVMVTPYLYRAVDGETAARADAALGRMARFGFTINYSQKKEHKPSPALSRGRDI